MPPPCSGLCCPHGPLLPSWASAAPAFLYSNSQVCKNVFKIGQGEAAALVNIVLNIPGECVEMLQAAVTLHGMWGGPFTHGALASPFLAMGHGFETGEAEWNLLMKNDLATCRLVCGRLVRDWEADFSCNDGNSVSSSTLATQLTRFEQPLRLCHSPEPSECI